MKKIGFLGLVLLFFLGMTGIYAHEGFTGPGKARQYQTVTVSQAKNLPDDFLVILTGNIIQSLGDEKYTFRDSTGDITIEIDRKVWRGLSVGVSDTVEIQGEVDVGRRGVKI